MNDKPRLIITMGDVAGIGPEIIAKAWPQLIELCQPVVSGDPGWMRWAVKLVQGPEQVRETRVPAAIKAEKDVIPCLLASEQNLSLVKFGRVSAAAGQAAYDFLCRAIDLTLAGAADGIVTAPLHKEGLRAAGLDYPGHTEILAERTGSPHYAMLLYDKALSVIHFTLHIPFRDVVQNLTMEGVLEKIRLLADVMPRLIGRKPRIGVAALNPHASDGGIFGDEENRIIQPAVTLAARDGIDVSGPWPCDTLFVRARAGEFDGVVAMYHDQGHIALKLIGAGRAVNVSVGLPLVRTSVAHGTAYDIAGQGRADAQSLVEAVRVASRLATAGPSGPG
jgi:4-hydroxythreonine-4-phosphate dehydrogenase